MRRTSVFFGLAFVLLGFHQAIAGSVNLTLLGAGPTGTVYMQASPLGGYSGDDFYAGVLDWTDKGGATPDYFTYCVDIASVISVNNTYNFNSETFTNLSSNLGSTFTAPVIKGIDNLWVNNYSLFQATLSGAINGTTNQEAAELQMALWDIIYNGSTGTLYSGTVSSSPLYFFSPNSSSALTTAMSLAATAYSAPAPTGATATADLSQLQALQATGNGQNQIFLGSASSVPLPTVISSFIVLMGLVGAYGLISKKPWAGSAASV